VPSPWDSGPFSPTAPGISMPGFHIPPLRGWILVGFGDPSTSLRAGCVRGYVISVGLLLLCFLQERAEGVDGDS
jgi:hypothetical protein